MTIKEDHGSNQGFVLQAEGRSRARNGIGRLRVVTVDDLHQHILAVWGKADGIAWAEPWAIPTAHHDTQTITIHPIVSEAAYATALHEIGHIRLGCHPGDDVLVDERSAWQWARANALIWTPTMEREAERSLGTYEAGLDKTEYYYEQVKQCTEDLLVGCKPDGLEVCDALVRNAVELAELYQQKRGFLLGLYARYSKVQLRK
jgi:hypothetical protein